jgi:hypothetical protein
LEELERDNIIAALESCGWKVAGESGMAQLLGMKTTMLSPRMKTRGVECKRCSLTSRNIVSSPTRSRDRRNLVASDPRPIIL